ncbi:MAG: pyridoxamine 5'-phosphate oxidase family protein [Anaerolineaceae bacterium]
MATWREFAAAEPEMAKDGRDLFYRVGIGLGYLATVRKDGGPRLHPFCPVIAGAGIYGFILNHSPKKLDLERDGRYAIHSFPAEEVDDEFYITGTARLVTDEAEYSAAKASYEASGGKTDDGETLFEFLVDSAMYAKYEARPSWPPVYSKWKAPKRAS